MAIDSGLEKERAMMAALFTDPEIAHLVTTHFVPVRLRLYTYAMSPYAAKVHCFLLYKGLAFEPYYINPLRVRRELPVGEGAQRSCGK